MPHCTAHSFTYLSVFLAASRALLISPIKINPYLKISTPGQKGPPSWIAILQDERGSEEEKGGKGQEKKKCNNRHFLCTETKPFLLKFLSEVRVSVDCGLSAKFCVFVERFWECRFTVCCAVLKSHVTIIQGQGVIFHYYLEA